MKTLKWSGQLFTAGHLLQGTKVTPLETGSLSRLSGSMETSAKYLKMGPADCRKRLQNLVLDRLVLTELFPH